MKRGPIAAAIAVSAFGVATAWAALASDLPVAPDGRVVAADLAAGVGFAVMGAVLWVRHPDSRIGRMTVLVGLASFLPDVRWFPGSIAWTLGFLAGDIHLLALAWVVLAFPTGRTRKNERVFLGAAAVYYLAINIAGNLFEAPAPGCTACPRSLLLIRQDPALSDRIWDIGQIVNLALIGAIVAMIATKWATSTRPARRGLSPVVWALGPIGLALVASFLDPLIGFGPAQARAVLIAERLALVAFPAALVAGMIRSDLARTRVADLARAIEESPDRLEDHVRTALGDPTARVAFWSPSQERLIDVEGTPIVPETGRQVTRIVRHGDQLGAVVHDPSVDPGTVDAVGATAGLALHNERLRAELKSRLIEVEASRERLAEATLRERRRLERDLHDGAQQRLLAIGALLGRARLKAAPEVAGLLDEAVAELRGTIGELREIARGVHPSILTERGLGSAISALAERSPVPVAVSFDAHPCRPAVEAAAYFLVAEALANTVKHADAGKVSVAIRGDHERLSIEVSDDGVGGADPGKGTGLQNLADRLAALGGGLGVSSGAQGGTVVNGWAPCG